MGRQIFKYNDGHGDVYADPAEIDYRMGKAAEDLDMVVIDEWLKLPKGDDGQFLPEEELTFGQKKNFVEACHRMLPVIRAGFQVPEFDRATGKGLTMEELLLLWASYREWQGELKKNIDGSPTVAAPTGSAPPSSPTPPAPSTPRPAVRPRSAFMPSTSMRPASPIPSEPTFTRPSST